MTIFQRAYNAIKSWQAPQWLKQLLQQLNDLMIGILKQVSKQYIDYLKQSIIEASGHSDWSNEQKFDYVFNQAKKGFNSFSITLKDSEINALIEFLVNSLKKSELIP